MKAAHGSVFKYGDNVDTDVIIPARYLNSSDPKELATHCMEDIDKDFVNNVKEGDIITISFGNKEVKVEVLDVQETVKKAVHKFAGQFIRKKLSLTLEPFSGTVVTDSKWFQFVVKQLLSNAIKYTECGGITISFEKETLCIADTGIGIAPEDLPRIFEKGYTGYNGRMDKKSSGIGLYLCQKTMEKLGGSIWAEAEIGEGSRFYIRFPKGSEKYE